jgi:hypothetical protein
MAIGDSIVIRGGKLPLIYAACRRNGWRVVTRTLDYRIDGLSAVRVWKQPNGEVSGGGGRRAPESAGCPPPAGHKESTALVLCFFETIGSWNALTCAAYASPRQQRQTRH